MELPLVVASLVLAIVAAVAIGATVLGQVQQAAHRVRQPVQFYLTDFAWLLVQMQVALALIVRYDFGANWANRMVLGFFAGALSAMWWGAVRALSQAGVRSLGRRAAFILLVLPAVEILMVLAALALGLGPITAVNVYRGEILLPWRRFGDEPDANEVLWAVIGGLALVAVILVGASVLLRGVTRWVLREGFSTQEAAARTA